MQAAALEEEPSVMPETEHPRVVVGAQGKRRDSGLTPIGPCQPCPMHGPVSKAFVVRLKPTKCASLHPLGVVLLPVLAQAA